MSSKEPATSASKESATQQLPAVEAENSELLIQPQAYPAEILQRARLDPHTLSPQDVLRLQSNIGNRAVAQLLAHTEPIVENQVASHDLKRTAASGQPAQIQRQFIGFKGVKLLTLKNELLAKGYSMQEIEALENAPEEYKSLQEITQALDQRRITTGAPPLAGSPPPTRAAAPAPRPGPLASTTAAPPLAGPPPTRAAAPAPRPGPLASTTAAPPLAGPAPAPAAAAAPLPAPNSPGRHNLIPSPRGAGSFSPKTISIPMTLTIVNLFRGESADRATLMGRGGFRPGRQAPEYLAKLQAFLSELDNERSEAASRAAISNEAGINIEPTVPGKPKRPTTDLVKSNEVIQRPNEKPLILLNWVCTGTATGAGAITYMIRVEETFQCISASPTIGMYQSTTSDMKIIAVAQSASTMAGNYAKFTEIDFLTAVPPERIYYKSRDAGLTQDESGDHWFRLDNRAPR